MDPDRKSAWLHIFHAWIQVWSWIEPTPERLRVWDGALHDLTPAQLLQGASYVLANHSGPQPPTPGELRDAVQGDIGKVAVRALDGRIVRWEKRRVKPLETQPLAYIPDQIIPGNIQWKIKGLDR